MITRLLPLTALILGIGAGAAQAQTLQRSTEPAEFPPASFTGKQYVDSKGCVYIRAGVGGQVTWVPRVARNRQVVCGFQPTFSSPPTEAAAPPQTDANVVQIQPAEVPRSSAGSARTRTTETAAAPAQPAVAPAPRRVVQQAPKVQPQPQPTNVQRVVRQAPQPVRVAPTVATVTAEPPRQAAQPVYRAPATTGGATSCPNLSPLAQQYMRSRPGFGVRCGPQAEPPSYRNPNMSGPDRHEVANFALRGTRAVPDDTVYLPATTAASGPVHAFRFPPGTVVFMGQVPPDTRIMPRHVWEQRQNTLVGQALPRGYRRAFDDDRLNPRRTEGTFAGKAQMELVWTNTVPRQLIDVRSGRNVTALYAAQVPVVSSSGSVADREAPSKAARRAAKVDAVAPQRTAERAAGSTAATRAVAMNSRNGTALQRKRAVADAPVGGTVSTRSAPVTRKPVAQAETKTAAARPAAGGHRYVQVGTFGVAANADRTAARLRAGGLPVRISAYTKGGTRYQIVMAGPFADGATLSRALSAARGAGFRDAFTR